MKQAEKPEKSEKRGDEASGSHKTKENTHIGQPPIVQPMIDEMRFPKDPPRPARGPCRDPAHAPEPAEQDQDSGGGYNPDHTIPQP